MNQKLVLLFILSFLLSGCTINTPTSISPNIHDLGTLNVYFCPRDNCEEQLVSFLNSAQKSIHCALFDVGLVAVQNTLLEKAQVIDVKVVTDNDYLKKFNHSFVKADKSGLMHNKFCIIDGKKVSAGSMNPTDNDAHKNNNNLLLIESTVLSLNYEQEFQEMWTGNFKGGSPVNTSSFLLNNISIQNYFCPEDHCAERVKEELKKAKESIYFMTFSFTHDGIANIILLKNLDNITIQGVMEARQITKDSQFSRLEYQGIDVIKDKNKQNLHHKVFVVDTETVITGSFNPTNGGDTRNDENILIIKDKEIAGLFMGEFKMVYEEGKK